MAGVAGQPSVAARIDMYRMYDRGQLGPTQIRHLEMDISDRSEIVDDQGNPASSPYFEDGVSTNTATYISPWIRWAAARGIGGLTSDFATMKAATNELIEFSQHGINQWVYVPRAALADPLGYGLPSSLVSSYVASNPGATPAQAAAALLPAQSINTILGRAEDLSAGDVYQTLGGGYAATSLPLGTMSTLAPAGATAGGLSPIMLIGLAVVALFLLKR